MLLLQRYWLRFSGIPAYLGEDTPPAARADAAPPGGVVLESSLARAPGQRYVSGADLRGALFLGLWSLTEAGLGARSKVWPLLLASGVVLLAFGNEFDGVDNARFLDEELRRGGLSRTHRILCWHLASSAGHYYLLAVRRDLGPVVCSPELNCRHESRHALVARGLDV